jgi:hypothetical protein
MSIHYRRMEPEDVPTCAALVASHPVVRPRYGESIRHLASTWLKLLGSDAIVASVFEEVLGKTRTVLGAGVAVFVTDDFVADLKAHPHFWIGPEIVARINRGKWPLLSEKQIRCANAVGGLNSATWHTGALPEYLSRPEVGNTIMNAFVELHRGFLLKEVICQAETAEHFEGVRAIGGSLWNSSRNCYEPADRMPPQKLLRQPHVLGITRELAAHRYAGWAAFCFVSHPPRFGFSRSEQRLLACGLSGETDQQIASKMGISLVAVKKRWRAIYDRVAAIAPELLPAPISENEVGRERGKTKKAGLLAYIHEHPEELRPVSRKLLRSRLDPSRSLRS